MRFFTLNPAHGDRFQRTLRAADGSTRLVRFTPGDAVELSDDEVEQLRPEIERNIIGPMGDKFPPGKKPRSEKPIGFEAPEGDYDKPRRIGRRWRF